MRATYKVLESFLSFKRGEELVIKKRKKQRWVCKTSDIRVEGVWFNLGKKKLHGNTYGIRCMPEEMLLRRYNSHIKRIHE